MPPALEPTIARLAALRGDATEDAVEALLVDGYAQALAADGYAAELERRVQALVAASGPERAERELLGLVAERMSLAEELGRLRQELDRLRRDRRPADVAV